MFQSDRSQLREIRLNSLGLIGKRKGSELEKQ